MTVIVIKSMSCVSHFSPCRCFPTAFSGRRCFHPILLLWCFLYPCALCLWMDSFLRLLLFDVTFCFFVLSLLLRLTIFSLPLWESILSFLLLFTALTLLSPFSLSWYCFSLLSPGMRSDLSSSFGGRLDPFSSGSDFLSIWSASRHGTDMFTENWCYFRCVFIKVSDGKINSVTLMNSAIRTKYGIGKLNTGISFFRRSNVVLILTWLRERDE